MKKLGVFVLTVDRVRIGMWRHKYRVSRWTGAKLHGFNDNERTRFGVGKTLMHDADKSIEGLPLFDTYEQAALYRELLTGGTMYISTESELVVPEFIEQAKNYVHD